MGSYEDFQTRYNRNIILSDFGEKTQKKLNLSKVLIIGAGGLGSGAAYYLAASGVGNITIADGDIVDLSNLQRQILHNERNLGQIKAQSAAEKLNALNSEITLNPLAIRFGFTELCEHLAQNKYDLVLECTDAMESKFLINDACVRAGVVLVRASAIAYGGQIMAISPRKSACLRCLYPNEPSNVLTGGQIGILGAAAGLFGVAQAAEAIKILSGIGEPLFDTLLGCDLRTWQWNKISLKRDEKCPICGDLA